MKIFDAGRFDKASPRDPRSSWKSTLSASSSFEVSDLKPREKDFSVCSTCGGSGVYLSSQNHRKKTYKSCDCGNISW